MRDTEHVNIINGSSLTIGGRSIFKNEFPLGEGWYSMRLRFNISVTIGTGTGAIPEGELKFIRNIFLRTDRGETLVNLPGRAIYKIATVKAGSPPRKDAVAAATAVYSVNLLIPFVDSSMLRPEDTILDTARYNSVTLDIQTGTVADLFTSVGTSSVTATLDCEVERSKFALDEGARPIAHITYEFNPPQDASSQTYVDLEQAPDLNIKRLYVHSCSSGVAGSPFSGTNADDVQDLSSLTDQSGYIVQERIHEMIQDANKDDYSLESVLTGIEVHDFVKDGSINSAIYTGDKSRLRYQWSNTAGVASGDLVTVAYEGVRSLKD